jgi:hypothetical protein
MIRVVRAEWRKLRRPTLFLGTIGSALFFTGLFTSLLFILIDSPRGNSDPANPISRELLSTAAGSVIGFSNVAGLLGIIAYCVFAAQTAQSCSTSGRQAHLDETLRNSDGFNLRCSRGCDLILSCTQC